MNNDVNQIAKKAIAYLKKHGLTIDTGWHLNGTPPEDIAEYLDSVIVGCFPTDEDELKKQVIELIEMEFPTVKAKGARNEPNLHHVVFPPEREGPSGGCGCPDSRPGKVHWAASESRR